MSPEELRRTLKLSVLVLLLSPLSVIGASFDCNKSRTFIERAICSNKRLSELDDRLAKAYRNALGIAFAPDELKAEQRNWLTTVRNVCQDNICLTRVYEQRLESLTTYDKRQRAGHGKEACAFPGLVLPESYAIFSAGGHSARELSFQIDQSGHQATQMDVAVNFPSKPVVLMLGAYEPTIWNISWSPATRIVAVLASGYYRQAIAGLDPGVPTLNTSYDNKGPCGYFYVGNIYVESNDLAKINPISRRLFGRPVDMVYLAEKGRITIGDTVPTGSTMVTSESIPPESFYDKTGQPAGPAGLEDAVRKGLLRKATRADLDGWVSAVIASTPNPDVPPIAGQGRPKPMNPGTYNAYVVLKPFTYPSGLYGAHAATFLIPKGIPRPNGSPGHSRVYDFNKLNCQGPLCRQ